MNRGRFITLEGIEGAGKSSVAAALCAALEGRGIAARLTREPGGTPLAERLRELVLARGTETITPVAETLMMFAARRLHLDGLIGPALESGQWVVCDRFTDATRAYQGGGRGVDAELIESLARTVHGDVHPDRTLLLDLPVRHGLARAGARGGDPDRFESETLAFFERVRARYLALARAEPARVVVLDATRPLDEVVAAAVTAALALDAR